MWKVFLCFAFVCFVSGLPSEYASKSFNIGIEYDHSLPMSAGADRYRHRNNYDPFFVTVTATAKVLCTLNFFGTGSYQTPVAKTVYINLSQPSISRCISEVVEALNHPTIFNRWIHMPETLQEINQTVAGFYTKFGIPGVVGAIDCTHVAIVPPAAIQYDERSYVNRKMYHSINTQLKGYVLDYLEVTATTDASGEVDFCLIQGKVGSRLMVFQLVSNHSDFLAYSYRAYGIREEDYNKIANVIFIPLPVPGRSPHIHLMSWLHLLITVCLLKIIQ